MLSPVWRVKMCHGDLFEPGSSHTLLLGRHDREAFNHALDLGCGAEVEVAGGLAGLMAVGQLADLYGMEGVCEAVEEAVLGRLTVGSCADALMLAQACGLGRVEAGCWALALGRFEAVAATEGFARVDEATLAALLADDALVAAREERVFVALARWMRHDPPRPAPHRARQRPAPGEGGGVQAVRRGGAEGVVPHPAGQRLENALLARGDEGVVGEQRAERRLVYPREALRRRHRLEPPQRQSFAPFLDTAQPARLG
jgi:hypothetical protein